MTGFSHSNDWRLRIHLAGPFIKKKKKKRAEKDQAKTAEKRGMGIVYYFLHAASSLCLSVFPWGKETFSHSVEEEERKHI